MKLKKLLKNIEYKIIKNFKNINIECISHNDKLCEKNSLFFALTGGKFDGCNFVNSAIEKGAKCIVSEKELDLPEHIVFVLVSDSRSAMSKIAKNFYNKPDEKLDIVAIIGTNGKTTTSFISFNILKNCGFNVGLIGTLGVFINDLKLPNDLTTPDPIELYYILNQMVEFNVQVVLLEASAHAIYLQKLKFLQCKLGVFTNISNEHLDFFSSMEKYAKTKISFFNDEHITEAIVNVDDEYGKIIAKNCKCNTISYGLCNPANVFAVDIKINIENSNFIVNFNDEILKIESNLTGIFNIYNILASICIAKLFKCDNLKIIESFKNMERVKGRFNVFKKNGNRTIVVDFAHTPDGFEKTLNLVKQLKKKNIITLFGCVSYSDDKKRKEMGKFASLYSDIIVLTADNPDNNSVKEISKVIREGISDDKKVFIIEDRLKAVKFAYKMMGEGFTLVLLGKGGEEKQKINGKYFDYDEIEIVKNL